MNDRIFFASASAIIIVPRVLRFIFCGRLRRKCCLHAGLPLTLPEAVVLKRFFALDFVLSFGILVPYFLRLCMYFGFKPNHPKAYILNG
jgi:hypothetical protein